MIPCFFAYRTAVTNRATLHGASNEVGGSYAFFEILTGDHDSNAVTTLVCRSRHQNQTEKHPG